MGNVYYHWRILYWKYQDFDVKMKYSNNITFLISLCVLVKYLSWLFLNLFYILLMIECTILFYCKFFILEI